MTTYHTPGQPGAQMAGPAADEESRTAADATKAVVSSAKDQTGEVLEEAKQQARDLTEELRTSLRDQGNEQRDRAVGGLRTLGDELATMADRGGESGAGTELARQASVKISDLASYLEKRDPGMLLDEVRDFARRKPGTFLLGAAIAGAVAGRFTRAASGQPSQQDGVHGTDVGTRYTADDELIQRGSYVDTGEDSLPGWPGTTQLAPSDVAPADPSRLRGRDPLRDQGQDLR